MYCNIYIYIYIANFTFSPSGSGRRPAKCNIDVHNQIRKKRCCINLDQGEGPDLDQIICQLCEGPDFLKENWDPGISQGTDFF